jgi:ornithine--oxo-acid transaminase
VPESAIASRSSYAEFVNPQWVRLLELLDMDVRYERCAGVELFSKEGERYLDFLSGYCVHNTGHNHPRNSLGNWPSACANSQAAT